MDWMLLLVVAGGAVALWRIAHQLRAARTRREDDWDTRLVERLRRGGMNPFEPVDVDFFVVLPNAEAAQRVAQQLGTEGFETGLRHIADATDQPFSVDARKRMQVNEVAIRGASARLRELAAAEGGRYDGWAPGGGVFEAVKSAGARPAGARPPQRRG